MATGKTKANKPKKSEKAALSYKVLEGMDGNPATPAEFDALPSNDGKFFFNPYEDATEDELDRCLVSSNNTISSFQIPNTFPIVAKVKFLLKLVLTRG